MSQLEKAYRAIFEGDGRVSVEAPLWLNCPGARTRLTRAQARELRDRFIQRGHSIHSGIGHTVWVSYAFCMLKAVDFEVKYQRVSGMGGWVVKILGSTPAQQQGSDMLNTKAFQISAAEKARLLSAAQTNADTTGVVYTIFFDTSGQARIERGLGPPGGTLIDRAYPKGSKG